MYDCVLRFPATFEAYPGAFDALKVLLDERDLHGRARYNVELVFEEVVTNIIRHGETARTDSEVEVALGFDGEAVVMRFHDDGVPFDPRRHVQAEFPSLANTRIGGLGITLVRHAAASIDYERTAEQQNRLTVTVPTG